MPLYTVITQEHTLSGEIRLKMACEITRIHAAVMKAPTNLVRVVFLSYSQGSGYAAGMEAQTAAVNCILRSGHSEAEKKDVSRQLWSMFQQLTGIATDQLAIFLQEIPASNAMKWGRSCRPSARNRSCRRRQMESGVPVIP
jgi:phenylpyruvate tautomerase PptA (4-oxalocrotonate tautomerase family)